MGHRMCVTCSDPFYSSGAWGLSGRACHQMTTGLVWDSAMLIGV